MSDEIKYITIIPTPVTYAERVAARKRQELLAEIEALEQHREEAEALLAPFAADVEAGYYDRGEDRRMVWGRNGYWIATGDNKGDVPTMARLLLTQVGWSVDTSNSGGLIVERPDTVTSAKLSDC